MNPDPRAGLLSNPESAFGEPGFVVDDKALSPAEKIRVLLDWRQDLLEQQTALAENMPRDRGDTNVATRLQAVNNALIELGHESR